MASNNSFTRATSQEFSLHSSLNSETGLFITIFEGTIAITGTLGNLIVLTVIFVQIRFSTVSNILIANVAAVDLLTATVIIPGDIGRHACERMGLCYISPTTILLHIILVHYVITAAAVALFVIAVERFIAIAFPFRYRSLFTRTRAKICVAATWISGVLITGIFFGLNFVFIMNILCLFLVLFTLCLYIYIFSIALKHERKIAVPRPQAFNNAPLGTKIDQNNGYRGWRLPDMLGSFCRVLLRSSTREFCISQNSTLD